VTDEDGTVTETKYDAEGNVTEETVTNPDGSKVVTTTAEDGTVTVAEYDEHGHETKETVTNPDGTKTVSEYNDDGTYKITDTNADGKITKIVSLDGDGVKTTTEYAEDGTRTITKATVGEDGEDVVFEQTVLNKDKTSVKTQYAEDGTVTVTKYDADGTAYEITTTYTDEDGITTVTVCDGEDNLIEETKTNADGKLIEKTEALEEGGTLTTKYDLDGKVTETIEKDVDGNVTTTVFAEDGSSVGTTVNPEGKVIKKLETAADGSSVLTEYNDDGTTTITTKDTNGNITLIQKRNEYGNVIQRTTFDEDGTPSVLDIGDIFKDETLMRVFGVTRYETSMNIADQLLKVKGMEKYDSVVITTGTGFADALPGSYLAKVKNAPIITLTNTTEKSTEEYIKKNVKAGGTVYIIGGVGAVSANMEKLVKNDGYQVKRLAGANRYDTNLAILEECNVNNEDILVCSGTGYADSLSASATGKPILIVAGTLSSDQAKYLSSIKIKNIYIVGGVGAVSASVEKSVSKYGTVKRLAGQTRYDTSILVAKQFFDDTCETAVLAYAQNFPDGLSGGPLACNMYAPLILTDSTPANYAKAQQAVKDLGIKKAVVIGGSALISDKAAKAILGQ
jgi:YD repeat-containing protein